MRKTRRRSRRVPGRITTFNLPSGPGVRVDTAIYSGYFVPPYYDSLIAKLIVHARTRERAIARMRRALEAMVIEGIKTTIPLHLKILDDTDFHRRAISRRDFMDRFLEVASARGRLTMQPSPEILGAKCASRPHFAHSATVGCTSSFREIGRADSG